MMRSVAYLILIAVLAGCATTGSYSGGRDSYQFMDKREEVQIIKRSGDLYLETLDSRTNDFDDSKSKRITFSPKEYKASAHFSKDGKYVLYATEERGWSLDFKFYVQPTEADDSLRREVEASEYGNLINGK